MVIRIYGATNLKEPPIRTSFAVHPRDALKEVDTLTERSSKPSTRSARLILLIGP